MEDSAIAAAAGNSFSMIVKKDGTVWGMGRNHHGQIGDGSTQRKGEVVFAQMIPGAIDVAAGFGHSLVLTADFGVWSAGWNKHDQWPARRGEENHKNKITASY